MSGKVVGEAYHEHEIAKRDRRITELEGEIALLRRAVVRYGDRMRMSTVADMELQQAIDRAFGHSQPTT